MHRPDLTAAIDTCYDAIIVPERWGDALHGLARALDSACIMFYPRNPNISSADPRNPDKPFMEMPISHDYRELLEEYIKNQWYIGHYRAQRGIPMLDAGRSVVTEHDLATDEERKKLAHYNELYLPFGFPGFAMIGLEVGAEQWAVPLLKGKSQGHFDKEDTKRLEHVAPHLRRMIHLSERLRFDQARASVDVLDQVGAAAMMLDWKGAVVRMNSRAEALVGADLQLRHGTLSATDWFSNQRLHHFVSAVTWQRRVRGDPLPEPILIHRTTGRPLHVDVLHVDNLIADIFHRAYAILIFTDLEASELPSQQDLRRCFGLTPAESRLALGLAAGSDLAEVADELTITRETARSTLRAIFAKTETHRQSELVLLLSRLGKLGSNLTARRRKE